MASTSDIRNGLCIEYNHDIFTIVEFQHVKPGKGNAFVRTRLKSLTTGRVIENTFPAGHKIDTVRVERREYQYLYNDGATFNFMNNETFEELALQETMIENADLLKEGAIAIILFHAEKEIPLSVELPSHMVLEVTYTEPGLKGDTATNTLKSATVETGAEVRVPLFVNQGDFIKVDTRDRSYIERVKQ
ncbi:MAG: elongation factor P [Saprospiraceae bacterium]|nr:elongation factor P [Saprospiraceae bacterium]